MALTDLDPYLLAELFRQKWLSPGQAAAVMNVSPATVHRWALSGKLDSIRKGRNVYYSAASCMREGVPGFGAKSAEGFAQQNGHSPSSSTEAASKASQTEM